jgi:hypothetical protein
LAALRSKSVVSKAENLNSSITYDTIANEELEYEVIIIDLVSVPGHQDLPAFLSLSILFRKQKTHYGLEMEQKGITTFPLQSKPL